MTQVAQAAQHAADSVFAYLARTADESPVGASWESLSYQNEPIRRPDLWDGVPGVALFLADYAAVTGSAAARELAARALRWSVAQAQTGPHPDPDSRPNVGRGAAGLALAYLHLHAAGDRTALACAAELADQTVNTDPARNPSLLWGTAGEALALGRVGVATGDERFITAAGRRAALLRDDSLPGALAAMDQRPIPLGLAPGAAGIGLALAQLLTMTRNDEWVPPIRHVATALQARAVPDPMVEGGVAWHTHTGPDAPVGYQWCVGTAGIGLFFAAASAALDDPSLLDTALAAGEATYAHGDARENPSLCHGLAGSAELLLQLHRATGSGHWLARAAELAEHASAYRIPSDDGDIWPADEPGLVAPNLSTGAAGIGRLFLQVAAPTTIGSLFLAATTKPQAR